MTMPTATPAMTAASPLPPSTLDICRSVGFELYKSRKLPEAEVVARGLVAADPGNWYHHSLLTATLQKQGRFAEAFAALDAGLVAIPAQPDLITLRTELAASHVRVLKARGKDAPATATTAGKGGAGANGADAAPVQVFAMLQVVSRIVDREVEIVTAWQSTPRLA